MNREFVMPSEGVKALGMSWNTKGARLTCSWRELEDVAGTPDASVYDVELNQASATESQRERKYLRAPKRGGVEKVAVVTGASRGIGAGIVQRFLAKGYGVVACSRNIATTGQPNLIEVAGDISQPETATLVIEAAKEHFGRVDTLVNNAGAFLSKPFAEYTENEFTMLLQVNLGGFFHISQKAIGEMLRRESGHIVNITSSLLAEQPLKALPAALTAITKGGLNTVTRSLAIEYAHKGIRVNAVAPGVIRTPMHAMDTHAFLATMHPMGRIGEIQEIVDAVLYLEGAAFVTGEILHVDGGAHSGRW